MGETQHLDWAIELSNTSKVNLIHRRDGFSGAESSVQKVKELNNQGKLNLYTKYQMTLVSGDKNIELVKLSMMMGKKENQNRLCSWFFWFDYAIRTNIRLGIKY